MLIKVARLGTQVRELALDAGSSVQNALDAADLTLGNEDIRVNQGNASVDVVLSEGDIVTLVPKVKGGQKIIKVARLGTAVREVAVDDSATVRDALAAADIQVENEEVRIDNRSANMSDRIGSGTLVTIVPKVKGGN